LVNYLSYLSRLAANLILLWVAPFKGEIYVCLQLVDGYFGVAQDGKPTPEQRFENARGVAGAMEGSVTSLAAARRKLAGGENT
jgi:hypothetical protein